MENQVKEAIRKQVVLNIEELINNRWYGKDFTDELKADVEIDGLWIRQNVTTREMDDNIFEEFVEEMVDFLYANLTIGRF